MISRIALALLFLIAMPAPALSTPDGPPTPDVSSPSVSPDGKTILFSTDVGGDATIYSAKRDGSDAKPLFVWKGAVTLEPSWSPDGKSIVVSSSRGTGNFNIWTTDADGKNEKQLTDNKSNETSPSFSPDGKTILFLSNQTGKREVWVMKPDGSEQYSLGLQHLIVNDVAWSPDGASIVYSGCVRPPSGGALTDGVCKIYIAEVSIIPTGKLAFSPPREIKTEMKQNWEPDWGPDGIVFSSMTSLWTVDADGQNLKELRSGNGLYGDPVWDRKTGAVIFSKVNHWQNIWETDKAGVEKQLTHYTDYAD